MSEPPKSWRDILPVHPAAETYPLLEHDDLMELGRDIQANGLRVPIVLFQTKSRWFLLDGRNRLDSMEAVGLHVVRSKTMPKGDRRPPLVDELLKNSRTISGDAFERRIDPYDFAISSNLHRRHLTRAQKHELISKLLKATPERRNRATAKLVGVSDKTVRFVRRKLEATAEIPRLEKIRIDGKARIALFVEPVAPLGDSFVMPNLTAPKQEVIPPEIFMISAALESPETNAAELLADVGRQLREARGSLVANVPLRRRAVFVRDCMETLDIILSDLRDITLGDFL
jgi:hypothetical protein